GCKGLGTYVSLDRGVDTAAGTQAAPVKTIGKAIANAVTIGGTQTVFVAGGHYPEKVTLVEKVSLEGGNLCTTASCTWTRDIAANDTAILNQDFEGVLAGSTITRATRVDGFRIMGKGGVTTASPGSAAITLDGASATVTNNKLVGGDVTGGPSPGATHSAAIAILAPTVDPQGALIDKNQITGGASSNISSGVFFTSKVFPPTGTSVAVVTNNTIRGGTAVQTRGILANNTGAGTLLSTNTILAGTCNGGQSWAISMDNVVTVDSNLLNVDQPNVGTCASTTAWSGGIQSLSSTSTIINNVVFGVRGTRTTAVILQEAEKPAGAVILNGNYLDGAGIGLAGNPTNSAAIVLRIGGGTNAILGKIRNNILAGGFDENRFGVFEEQIQNKTNKPAALENNDFFFSTQAGRKDVFYRAWTANAIVDTTTAPALLALPTANFTADPLVDATFHISKSPASPCINAGTMTEASAKDRDGDSRGKGGANDVGADEAN
ncbi:MAG: uncharacterized protein JWM74_2177, partial [Myxococcaceae bacterium]|nr:uncharacterized protein [Myxococcaceae bacterium]